jgi:hypothetical protein
VRPTARPSRSPACLQHPDHFPAISPFHNPLISSRGGKLQLSVPGCLGRRQRVAFAVEGKMN